MRKIVLSLSGGLDSSTLLSHILQEDPSTEVTALFFYYGSKHNPYEIKAFHAVVKNYNELGYKIIPKCIELNNIFKENPSNLMSGNGEIPEGHYEDETMKLTVVPGRNLIFASIMASVAESIGAEAVYLGVHAGDHAIYPDCRKDFLLSLHNTVLFSTEGKVKIHAPFLDMTKTEIVTLGLLLNTPYHLTRTCYKEQEIPCGKCGSCRERLEAFTGNFSTDPLIYEE